MGKRNWLFVSTEVGARRVGIIQSLMVTCRLHGVDPYTYLVDVLQRISEHPAKRVCDHSARAKIRNHAHLSRTHRTDRTGIVRRRSERLSPDRSSGRD